MDPREKVLKTAENEIGYAEENNSNKTIYGEWFGLNGVPWCAIFVSWVYNQAGFPLGNIGYTKGMAGCQYAVAHFKKTNEVVNNPQPGDIVFFDWNGDGRYDHVGIFKNYLPGGKHVFETIEGNTSTQNDSNGGMVMIRKRTNKSNPLFVSPKVININS